MKTIASLNLLENGNVDFQWKRAKRLQLSDVKKLERLVALEIFWDNPELQALLDKFIEADKGGMS